MGDCIACETTRAAGVKTCQVPVQPPWAQRAPFLSAATYRTADSVKLKATDAERSGTKLWYTQVRSSVLLYTPR